MFNQINKLKKTIHNRLPEEAHSLLKGKSFIETYRTLIIKVVSLGLTFVTSVLLARLLGSEGYGTYAYALSWINLLSVFAVFGIDSLFIRETSVHINNKNWDRVKGLLKWGNTLSLSLSLLLAFSAAGIAWFYIDETNSVIIQSLWIALILLPFMSLRILKSATLQGLNKIAIGQISDDIVRPVFFALLLGITFLFFRDTVTPQYVMGFNVTSYIIAFLTGLYILFKYLPSEVMDATPEYTAKKWLKAAMILSFLGAIYIVNREIRTLMLGALGTIEDVGIFTVALRGADFILLPINVINAVVASKFASLYAKNDMIGLQSLFTKATRAILAITIPCATILIVFSDFILGIFGESFLAGKLPLAIICIGSVVSSSMGSVGLLLTMTGHESLAARAIIYSLIFNVILNLLLIPEMGVVGAAWSSAISLVALTGIYAWLAFKKLKINPFPFRIKNTQ